MESKIQPKTVRQAFDGVTNNTYTCPKGFPTKKPLKKLPAQQIIAVIDCSGSTDNAHNRNRFPNDNEEMDEATTKIIIYALLEGIANHLRNMAKIFDLTGVQLIIYSFSTNLYHCGTINIATYCILESILQNLNKIIVWEGMATYLLPRCNKFMQRMT
jgi:hypothetical protein